MNNEARGSHPEEWGAKYELGKNSGAIKRLWQLSILKKVRELVK